MRGGEVREGSGEGGERWGRGGGRWGNTTLVYIHTSTVCGLYSRRQECRGTCMTFDPTI